MHEHGKSDRRVVPTKPPNNGHERPAEGVEGRRLAKGNLAPANHVPDAAPGSHVP